MVYYAKSPLSNGEQPTVKQHLEAVSRLAGEFGEALNLRTEAEQAGLLHDFGKYSEAFQDVLKGKRHNVDHAVGGAAFLYGYYSKKNGCAPLVEAINGHHDGLTEFEKLKSLGGDNLCGMLEKTMRSNEVHSGNAGKTAALNGTEYNTAFAQLMKDFPTFRPITLQPLEAEAEASMLLSRMLLSCLADADYSVSASDEDPDYLKNNSDDDFDPRLLLQKLYQYMETIRGGSTAAGGVNALREELFERCGEAGDGPEGLYTLTAPTGTGKTLALLHFALRHCAATGKKRIIIVLPFLTLAEQNTAIYQKILPNVLVDHSQSNLPDDMREFAARWSVPVIVTTTVRFFESLFARKPTDCRKLHHIADSVILFDEAQSLPPEVTNATLRTVRELCRRYRCTMVFSTATQPDFRMRVPEWCPTEILPDHRRMYQAIRRVHVDWRLNEPTPLESIADQMVSEDSVCAIVNLRKHARKLFDLLSERCAKEELFFLTTDLCAAHRTEIVAEIKRRMASGLPCRVVATQCIEAGVDLDFRVLFRALAPLDSVIQAAGRCNRNGRDANGGRVVVFIPDEEGRLYPGDWYHNAAQYVRMIALRHEIDINDPDHIREYYGELFRNAKDKKRLTDAISKRSFEETEREYKLIENRGYQVIVPYEGLQALYREIEDEIRALGMSITPALMKRSAPITVTVPYGKEDLLKQYAENLTLSAKHGRQKFPGNYYLLRAQYRDCYDEKTGLRLAGENKFDGFW